MQNSKNVNYNKPKINEIKNPSTNMWDCMSVKNNNMDSVTCDQIKKTKQKPQTEMTRGTGTGGRREPKEVENPQQNEMRTGGRKGQNGCCRKSGI